MKIVFLLLVAFVAIGVITRTYNKTARFLLIGVIGVLMIYATTH